MASGACHHVWGIAVVCGGRIAMRMGRLHLAAMLMVTAAAAWGGAAAYGGEMAQAGGRGAGGARYEAEGLAVVLGDDASVRAVESQGRELPLLGVAGGFEVAEYEGAAKGARTLEPVVTRGAEGFVLSYEEGALTLGVRVEELAGHIALHGRLRKTTAEDRALIVSFALPVNAWGWNWWDDPSRVRRIGYGVEYANYGFLGEKRDIPVSQMPFATIASAAAGAGIAVAVPIDEPRICRFNYSTEKGLRVEFNLGLSSATEKFPDSADFTILSMPRTRYGDCGRRPQTYYGLFPEAYARRIPREGVSTWRITEEFMPPPEYIEKWGIAFRWMLASEVSLDARFMQYLRDNGIIALKHQGAVGPLAPGVPCRGTSLA